MIGKIKGNISRHVPLCDLAGLDNITAENLGILIL